MGIADLTSPRAKLWWANEHLSIFNKEFGAFFATEPKSVTIKFSREKLWHVAYIDPLPLPPGKLVLIAGDILSNLRAVLDHLIRQLVLREDQKPCRFNHFPITESEKQFLNDVENPQTSRAIEERPLQNIADGDVWTIIKKAQPFQSTKPKPQEDALLFLSRMNNVDKHRTLLIQRALPDEKTTSDCIYWDRNFHLIREKSSFATTASHERPTEIKRFQFASERDPRMHVKGEFRVFPTLGDGKTQRPFDILTAAHLRVKEILDEVAALLGVKDVPPSTDCPIK